jgi:hypothetical protein
MTDPAASASDPRDPEIVPDTKDWTWVLRRPCPECGVDVSGLTPADLPSLLRANARVWESVLADDAGARVRPAPGRWAPVEYAAHVRDVFEIFQARLGRMRAEDDPLFANWDQDVTALEKDYAHAEPAQVAQELSAAAQRAAVAFGDVPEAEWGRTARRSDGAAFTVRTLAAYFAHDWLHHAWDVTGVRPTL